MVTKNSQKSNLGVTKSMNFFQKIIKPFKRSSNRGLEDDIDRISAQEQKVFTFQALVSATKDFNPTHKLGEGGFGPVFKPGHLEEPEHPGVPGSRHRRRTHRPTGASSVGTLSTTGSRTDSFGSNLNTHTGGSNTGTGKATPLSSRIPTPTRTHATRSVGAASGSSDPHGKRPMSY
ncbi:hypothetical protein F2Q69_00050605 [Brassica cretica]|uniref:Uncharacterized protein n=1 Tax=Brassica cretica TaxID=69181 RepID=A0A8S9PKL6_BRACR|nr:hypothetical protein F2Q69_00050605 [Brassica cretica]